MHPLPIGTRVCVQDTYDAAVQEVGPVPVTAPCGAYHGLPGYRVLWYALDEKTGAYTGELEPDEASWVVQAHCIPV